MRALLSRVAVVLVAGGVLLAFGQHAAEAATVNITVGNFYFCNPSFENGRCDTVIHVGDTVTWNFLPGTLTNHTTTECGANCDTPTGTPLWNETRAPGGTYSRVFSTPGVFLYQCTLHAPVMRGRIVVKSAVGGSAKLADIDRAGALARAGESGTPAGMVAGVIAAFAASVIALAGGAWYVRRRWLT